jgi:hypothetical protein
MQVLHLAFLLTLMCLCLDALLLEDRDYCKLTGYFLAALGFELKASQALLLLEPLYQQ